jgi:uncharacterized membrane protein
MSASPSSAGVQLLLTDRMRAALKQCNKRLPAEVKKSHEFQQLAATFRAAVKPQPSEQVNAVSAAASSAPPATLTLSQVQALSRFYRSTLPGGEGVEPAEGADSLDDVDASLGSGFVHELLHGSGVAPLPPVRSSRRQDPAFKRYLEEQRIKQERREYAKLVADLPGNRKAAARANRDDDLSIGANYASAQRDIGHGVNILTLMITGFVVFYYVGNSLFPHNNVFAVMTGLIGLIGALMLEVCLFLVREQKKDRQEAQQIKIAKDQKKKELEFQIREKEKTKLEMERRLKALQQQPQPTAADPAAKPDASSLD